MFAKPNSRWFAPALLLLAGTAATASTRLGDRWPVVGFDREQDCRLELRSNPIAIRIEASGLIPGETLRIIVRNGAMKPIRAVLRASANGRFSEYYAPLKSSYGASRPLFDEGGKVDIEIDAARCTLSASAPWTYRRQTIP